MMGKTSRIMTVLPPKEGFSPGCVGAIGLLVQCLAQPQDLIVGKALDCLPFVGLHYLEISKSWYSLFIQSNAYRCGVSRLVQKYRPCLVEIHNRPEIALYIAQKYPYIPVSLTLHNDPLSMRGLKKNIERHKIVEKLHVVAVSEWVKDRFLSGQVKGSVTILPNYIDCKKLPQYIPIPERKKNILFVGRVVADKGADIFVALCCKLLQVDPSWNIEIIGADRFKSNSPETPFIQKLRHQLRQTQIKMVGYLPYDQVLQKISEASIVIMPSRWPEPFGMTALEAMACGTPLLVSAVGALPKVVGNGALLMDPTNIEQAFQQLIRLVKNQDLREQLSLYAKEQAFRYNSEQALQALNSFRKQICPQLQGNL
ncbi:glycosyltransferase family 4 protein [Commensalibacter papalotli (ex Botero et al. 2024)]|uniref:Glycosyltransferase involved in cell wall bisynthesis (RfaB) (PDB:2IV7) n=1 Tax=Commensalibacter papalotli (ex Botero et al. 2024) TaxID=2972766 RepID=A0ABM9HL51_9PROT|nr:glycosyltransferase family 4 protein [Commensalibacter papalotli (ex Botero et al. 2024)]CAI3933020.1 Glycosyltransferase involved in cell wall bisynthesis (RfaB) (PDB:2IV7) [Commensalibacter papalotli (ex Botero et al. 2024)]CAI3949036.1 Glycosyltransferase involved in cell wall bisynthesis (RfaB) (PDB:2IV7) [Commensalibacter papalotli (ex Botero et al. 2024)]